MKKIFFYSITAVILLTTACNSGSKESNTSGIETSDKEITATFTVDATDYKGKVSTQYFGSNKETDNFSVLCQQSDPLVLLQAVFANEKDAQSVGLKPNGSSYNVGAGNFGLELTIAGEPKMFIANPKSGGTVTVKRHKMIITNMKLFDQDGKEKTVSGTINF